MMERVWAKVDPSGDCWEWTGAKGRTGYGLVWSERRVRGAHRVVYEALVGPIPDGMQIDHLCRNRACVNPDHLEAVTRQENIRRGFRVQKMTCPQGHPYDESNTYRFDGRRYCRACHAVYSRENKERARA